jgi:hypothetical protein
MTLPAVGVSVPPFTAGGASMRCARVHHGPVLMHGPMTAHGGKSHEWPWMSAIGVMAGLPAE